MQIANLQRKIAKYLPRGLYRRTLIIIIAPMILLQSVIAYIFMDKHWQMVTEHLTSALANDISAIVDLLDKYPGPENYDKIAHITLERLNLTINLLPKEPLPIPSSKPFFDLLDYLLTKKIKEKINKKFWIDTVGNSKIIEIRIALKDQILQVFAKRSQAYSSNIIIFLGWMGGTASVLLLIAIYFLRLQISPIQQLAIAAEKFGRGEDHISFRPQGAIEVRQAGIAFLRMKQRIARQIEQRTMMLSGVSHDLRTILTRFRLGLSLLSDKEIAKLLEQDVIDMTHMIDAYLAFSRNQNDEESIQLINLNPLVEKIYNASKLYNCHFESKITYNGDILVRPLNFERLLNNIANNAFKYAKNIKLVAKKSNNNVIIYIDDDGPGIADNMRQQVFKPFFRIEEARNLNKVGTGLGLSIAADIARSHGGNITLDDSPMGGLRVIIIIPNNKI